MKRILRDKVRAPLGALRVSMVGHVSSELGGEI